MGRIYIHEGMELTPEQIKRLDALKNLRDEDIVYDGDSTRLTEEQLKKFRRVSDMRKVVV